MYATLVNYFMRLFLVLLLLASYVSHAQTGKQKHLSMTRFNVLDRTRFPLDSQAFPGHKQLDSLLYEDRKVKAIGYYAVDGQGTKTFLRVGQWTEFYRNGQIMSIGSYNLQSLLSCHDAMPGVQYYSFKIGDWKYFYEDGAIKAKGTYQIQRVQVSTGVANQFKTKSLTTADWIVNDEKGRPAPDRQRVLVSLERLHL
jgi:hypothetical protein